jgi:hypothetical protein
MTRLCSLLRHLTRIYPGYSMRSIWVGLLHLASLTSASPARAQKTTVPESLLAQRAERTWWMGQLRQARQFGGRALAGLQGTQPNDSDPVEETVLQAARDTYVLIRSARGGIEMARSDRRHNDPVLDLVFRRVDEAWVLARAPVDQASWGKSKAEYLDVSISSLRQSLRLLDQVFVLMP